MYCSPRFHPARQITSHHVIRCTGQQMKQTTAPVTSVPTNTPLTWKKQVTLRRSPCCQHKSAHVILPNTLKPGQVTPSHYTNSTVRTSHTRHPSALLSSADYRELQDIVLSGPTFFSYTTSRFPTELIHISCTTGTPKICCLKHCPPRYTVHVLQLIEYLSGNY